MEFKLKLKYILGLTLAFWILICINWYGNMNYVVVDKQKHASSVSHSDLIKADQYYKIDYNKNYNWEHSTTKKVTKGKFPFTFNEEIMEKTEPSIVENKY